MSYHDDEEEIKLDIDEGDEDVDDIDDPLVDGAFIDENDDIEEEFAGLDGSTEY